MKPLDLTDLVPRGSAFTLSIRQDPFKLRAFTVADEIWLAETFGDRADKIFAEGTTNDLCRIAFHQMQVEDQKHFAPKSVELVDENGNTAEIQLGGFKLMAAQMVGHQEKMGIAKAVLETVGISRPILDKIEDRRHSELKKNLERIGAEFSTSYPPNTVGQPNTSSRVRRAKSHGALKG